MVKVNTEELLTYLILIIIGYFIAKMFSRMCSCRNCFSVGVQQPMPPSQCEVVIKYMFSAECANTPNCMTCTDGLDLKPLSDAGCTNTDLQNLCNDL